MRHKQAVFIALFFALISFFFIGYSLYISSRIIKIDTLLMDVEVTDNSRRMGFNVDTDALHFGTMARGATGGRFIRLNNTGGEPAAIQLVPQGQFASWIVFDRNNFVLGQQSNVSVHVTVHVPPDAPLGVYNGTMEVVYRKMAK